MMHARAAVVGDLSQADAAVFVASLQTSAGVHYCSGTLIAPSVLLTAGQCVHDTESPVIGIAAVTDEDNIEPTFQLMESDKAIVHPRYNSTR